MIPNHIALMILRSASLFFIVIFADNSSRYGDGRYGASFSGLLSLLALSIALGSLWVLGISPALRPLWRRLAALWHRRHHP